MQQGDSDLMRELVEASSEVDESLIDWFLSLSDRERLRSCTNAARALRRLQGECLEQTCANLDLATGLAGLQFDRPLKPA